MRRIILVFFGIAGLLWLTACNASHATERQPDAPVVRGLALITAERASVPDVLEAVGNVRAAQSATVASQAMGYVLSVHAAEGDRVHRGQLLAVIDDAQPKAAVQRAQAGVTAADQEAAAAETDYKLTHTTLNRYEQLAARDVISAHDFDEIKARADASTAHRDFARAGQAQARAAQAEAQTALAHTRVVAPFDGIITEKKVDPGALAAPGTPLFSLDASGRYRLDASVDESSLRFVRERQSVPVILDALGPKAVTGTVALIVPAADSASRSFVVKVDLPLDPGIRSGLFGRAQFSKGTKETLVVPADAVVERGQIRGVYVIGEDRIAQMRLVTTGRTLDGRVEILSGVTPGERLVAAPGTNDLGGKRVEVSDAAQTRR